MSEALLTQLRDFSAEIRTFEYNDNSAFNQDKLAIYQSLVLGNATEVITPCFPILSALVGEDLWLILITNLLKSTQLSTPIFHELPYQLVKYLKTAPLEGFPFAADLADYEQLELALELSLKTDEQNTYHEAIDYLSHCWRLSDGARLVSYDYDVHNISIAYQPKTPIHSHYLLYEKEERIHFMTLPPPSFQLLNCILAERQTPKAIIDDLCLLFDNFNKAQLLEESNELIRTLSQLCILIPTK